MCGGRRRHHQPFESSGSFLPEQAATTTPASWTDHSSAKLSSTGRRVWAPLHRQEPAPCLVPALTRPFALHSLDARKGVFEDPLTLKCDPHCLYWLHVPGERGAVTAHPPLIRQLTYFLERPYGRWFQGRSEMSFWPACCWMAPSVLPSLSPMTRVGVLPAASSLRRATSLVVQGWRW